MLNRSNIVTNFNNNFKNGKEIISALNSGLTEIGQSRIFRKVVVEDGPTRPPFIYIVLYGNNRGLPWWLRWYSICLQCRRPRFDPWVGKIPWRRKWQPTPVFLPGKSHGRWSLVGYCSWSRKGLDTTEWLHFHSLYGNRWVLHTSSLTWVSCYYCHFKGEDTEA